MKTQSAGFWHEYIQAMSQLFQAAMLDPEPLVDPAILNLFQFKMSDLSRLIQNLPGASLQTLPAFLQCEKTMANQLGAELFAAQGQSEMACSQTLVEDFVNYFAAAATLLTEWLTLLPESTPSYLLPFYDLFQRFARDIEHYSTPAGEAVHQALNAFWSVLSPGLLD